MSEAYCIYLNLLMNLCMLSCLVIESIDVLGNILDFKVFIDTKSFEYLNLSLYFQVRF